MRQIPPHPAGILDLLGTLFPQTLPGCEGSTKPTNWERAAASRREELANGLVEECDMERSQDKEMGLSHPVAESSVAELEKQFPSRDAVSALLRKTDTALNNICKLTSCGERTDCIGLV